MSQLNIDNIANQLGTGGPDFVGMPSVGGDPVVESGSNSDGEWTRWADGTQEVWKVIVETGTPTADGNVAGVYTRTILNGTNSFPMSFVPGIITKNVSISKSNNICQSAWGGSHTEARWPTQVNSVERASSASSGTYTVFLSATGRWK